MRRRLRVAAAKSQAALVDSGATECSHVETALECWVIGPGFASSAKPDRDRANADCRSPLGLLSQRDETRADRSVERKFVLGKRSFPRAQSRSGERRLERRHTRVCSVLAPVLFHALALSFLSPFLITTAMDPPGVGAPWRPLEHASTQSLVVVHVSTKVDSYWGQRGARGEGRLIRQGPSGGVGGPGSEGGGLGGEGGGGGGGRRAASLPSAAPPRSRPCKSGAGLERTMAQTCTVPRLRSMRRSGWGGARRGAQRERAREEKS